MKQHTQTLRQLIIELFTEDQQKRIQMLVDSELPNIEAVISFDDSLEGPSISRINCQNLGRYKTKDRYIFRPLQYCGMHFMHTQRSNDAKWHTRDFLEMSSLHIEALIKNIGGFLNLPLGMALHKAIVKAKVDLVTWKQIETYTHVYNDAKHNFSHKKDTHMFSVEDALLAYFVCRKLAVKLYPLAKLATNMKIFDIECDETEIAQLTASQ